MSNTRKPNGSPLLREVFKVPASPVDKAQPPVMKTKKSLNDIDEMYKHPRSNPLYAHLFSAKAEAKHAEANKSVTDESAAPKPINP